MRRHHFGLGHLDLIHAVEDDGGSPLQQGRLAHPVVETRLGHHRCKARRLLGYVPTHDLREGLAETVKWFAREASAAITNFGPRT